jgi:hypothetical protein
MGVKLRNTGEDSRFLGKCERIFCMSLFLFPLFCSCGWDVGKDLFTKTSLKGGKTITTVSGTGNSQGPG